MTIHIVRITALTAFIVLCTVLPFLPGRYDILAVSLSKLSLLFGKLGLVLVPLGALWLGVGVSEPQSRETTRLLHLDGVHRGVRRLVHSLGRRAC